MVHRDEVTAMALTRTEVSTVFYHGGVAELAVGDFILPARLAPHDANDLWYLDLGTGDFCFVTTDLLQAWYSALNCEHERGDAMVYRVQPIGRLWIDEDEGGKNFACRKARILACHHVPRWAREAYKANKRAFMDELYAWVEAGI
jgi:hypothetical protein